MFAAAVLLAIYSTFGPIAQTERVIYTVTPSGSVLERVVKDDRSIAPFALAESPYRIAAVDIDGDEVLYGTAVREKLTSVAIPPDGFYSRTTLELVDTGAVHSILRVHEGGGVPQTLISGLRGVTELAHDASWIYWVEPSSGLVTAPAADAALRRIDKSGLVVETVASGLTIPYNNQHPFVLAGDDVYVSSGGRLLRISKSGGPARLITTTFSGSAIAMVGDVLYFSCGGAGAVALQTRTDLILGALALPIYAGAISILAAGPGLVIAESSSGSTGLVYRQWHLFGECPPAASVTFGFTAWGSRYGLYFMDPLSAPPIAIDDRGVWMRDQREITFASPPEACSRRRATRH
ncbi:MAG: hypothetical protein QOI24_3673 [Acidobacteriota bacterium]|jgi:hypothetical protein|nr:hypothetical protein [Acidobacteriota bacterium]